MRADVVTDGPATPPTFLILLIASLAPFALGVIVPGLAEIGHNFGAGPAEIQFVVTVFIAGLGISQAFIGPLADLYGRKRVLLICLAGFVVASFFCTSVTQTELLIFGRLIQAVGVAAGGVIVRAIITDCYEPKRAAQMMSYMAASIEVSMLISAPVGGRLVSYFGWSALFVVMGAYGAVILGLVFWGLPETRGREPQRQLTLRGLCQNYMQVLRLRVFLGYVLVLSVGVGAGLGLYTIFPLLMSDNFGYTSTTIGDFLFANGVVLVIGALVAAQLARRFGIDRVILTALLILVAISLLFFGLVKFMGVTLYSVIVPLFLLSLGRSVLMPLCFTGAVGAHPQLAGTASGLAGVSVSILMALTAGIVAALYDGNLLYPAIALVVLLVSGLFIYLALLRGLNRSSVPP